MAPDKAFFFFHLKSIAIFVISSQKRMLWFSLEAPRRVASNAYTQQMFSWRNKKKY